MLFRTPLARARGLGSAKQGTQDWWRQRLTSIALVPLSLWFGLSVASLPNASYESVVHWLHAPGNSIALLALIVATFYHATLGLQVIIEDYVHTKWAKLLSSVSLKLFFLFAALTALHSVLRVVLA